MFGLFLNFFPAGGGGKDVAALYFSSNRVFLSWRLTAAGAQLPFEVWVSPFNVPPDRFSPDTRGPRWLLCFVPLKIRFFFRHVTKFSFLWWETPFFFFLRRTCAGVPQKCGRGFSFQLDLRGWSMH